jgi:hypothetical protein
VLAAAVVLAAAAMPTAQAGSQSSAGDRLTARLLDGAIDVHAHVDPDSAGPNSIQGPRLMDVDDLARLALERGMRGFVAKQHHDTTAHLVYLVRKAVPGIEVFGLVALNRAMGGVNPAAVLHMAEVKGGWGRIVNMPTWDAEFYVRSSNDPARPFVSVSRDGELLPEVREVIAIMARTTTRDSGGRMVLYTGHSSPEESLMMVREARRLGVPVMVSHPMIEFIDMPLSVMEEAARLGAYLELVSAFATGGNADEEIERTVDAIGTIGAGRFILSSDRGQANGPAHPDGLATAARALLSHGVTESELGQMMKDNPARLLGLAPSSGR